MLKSIWFRANVLAGFGAVPFGADDASVAAFVFASLEPSPEMFGLHPSASLVLHRAEGQGLLRHLGSLQPKYTF